MTQSRPPFPTVIDSTFLASVKSCEVKALRTYVEHWKPKGESIHLVAGGAFAKGLEVARRAFWEDKQSPADSVALGVGALIAAYGEFEAPEGSTKTLDRVAGALEFYFSNCPLAESAGPFGEQIDGRPALLHGTRAIEFSFAQPLPLLHPESGEPLIYSGRSDMIVNFADGIYIWDDKTTSSLGNSWASSWELRSQFTGYCWAAREMGIPVDGVVTNGVSILKTKYDYQRAITYRAPWELDRWLANTVAVLERFIESWKSGHYIYNFDDACTAYGGCALREVCKSPNPEQWLPMSFERRVWDPLSRTETPLSSSPLL